jgi:hypothetical protein
MLSTMRHGGAPGTLLGDGVLVIAIVDGDVIRAARY